MTGVVKRCRQLKQSNIFYFFIFFHGGEHSAFANDRPTRRIKHSIIIARSLPPINNWIFPFTSTCKLISMAQDTNKDQFFPESPLEEYEFPPSYDSSLATGAGPSQPVGSTGEAQGRTIPEHIRFLFTGPTNAEPLLGSRGHDLSVRERVKRVEWVKKGDQIQSTDPKLSDRVYLVHM